jgi:hypothetical protein
MGTLVVEPFDQATRPDGSPARPTGRPDTLSDILPDILNEPTSSGVPRGSSDSPARGSSPTFRQLREVDWVCEWWPPT